MSKIKWFFFMKASLILLDHHSPSNKWTYSRHLCLQRWLWHGILIDSFFEQADIFQSYFSICQDLTFELQLLAPFVLCLKSAVSSRCLISYQLIYTLHYMHAQSQAHAQFIRLNGILFIIHNIMLLLPATCNWRLLHYSSTEAPADTVETKEAFY